MQNVLILNKISHLNLSGISQKNIEGLWTHVVSNQLIRGSSRRSKSMKCVAPDDADVDALTLTVCVGVASWVT